VCGGVGVLELVELGFVATRFGRNCLSYKLSKKRRKTWVRGLGEKPSLPKALQLRHSCATGNGGMEDGGSGRSCFLDKIF